MGVGRVMGERGGGGGGEGAGEGGGGGEGEGEDEEDEEDEEGGVKLVKEEEIRREPEARSFCSTVCKQGYVPVGVDGSVKGWQADFLTEIGLSDLCEDDFSRLGGVDGVVSQFLFCRMPLWPFSVGFPRVGLANL